LKTKPTVDITCDVIKLFKSDPIDATNRIDLHVVKWSSGRERVLEKRRAWVKADGTIHYRQLVGMTARDLEFVFEHQQEIEQTLKGV
jgi:hypothetical protein